MKNKTIFFKKWPTTGRLDAHLISPVASRGNKVYSATAVVTGYGPYYASRINDLIIEDARETRRQHYRAVCVSGIWYRDRESRMQCEVM